MTCSTWASVGSGAVVVAPAGVRPSINGSAQTGLILTVLALGLDVDPLGPSARAKGPPAAVPAAIVAATANRRSEPRSKPDRLLKSQVIPGRCRTRNSSVVPTTECIGYRLFPAHGQSL